jgi:DMSO/TMAO reductase YedYZ molybdopterin-dependent catalytic subunit
MVELLPEAQYVWSDGLDYGEFAGVRNDRYQKDLPIEKSTSPEVLLAYNINGAPLSRTRGGQVRLVVPGSFGANMTKWFCRLSLQPGRAQGPFTTTVYNERDLTDSSGRMQPVWEVEPNSMIVTPSQDAQLEGP